MHSGDTNEDVCINAECERPVHSAARRAHVPLVLNVDSEDYDFLANCGNNRRHRSAHLSSLKTKYVVAHSIAMKQIYQTKLKMTPWALLRIITFSVCLKA